MKLLYTVLKYVLIVIKKYINLQFRGDSKSSIMVTGGISDMTN